MSESNRALLLIARRPEPGRAKTRLTPHLSRAQAAALYDAFLKDSLDTCQSVPGVSLFVLYAPARSSEYFRALAPGFALMPQRGRDLGQRLHNAFTCCFAAGFRQAAVLASDSPTLPAGHVACAFSLLDEADVAFGPAEDGGYYLVALSRPHPRLFAGVRMSTSSVLRDSIAIARDAGLRVALLPEWRDIDTAEDLERLSNELEITPPDVAPHTRACLRALGLMPE